MREVAADPDALEQTYEEWVAVAERAIRTLEAEGRSVAKVPVDTEELVRWCNEKQRPVDPSARAEFASWKLYEADQGR